MKKNQLRLLVGSLLFVVLTSLVLCVLPRDPNDPSNATLTPVVKNSQGVVVSHSAEDTVFRTIEIGAAIHLPEYFDSVKIAITAEGVEIKSEVLKEIDTILTDDTVWLSMVFETIGFKNITITPYSSIVQLAPVSAMIGIVNGTEPQKINHSPALSFNGNPIIKPGETCQLSFVPTDEDEGQTVTLSLAEAFEGATLTGTSFTWPAPATFVGVKTLKVKATDNGVPPKDTTIEVAITVTATPHPPTLSIMGKNKVKPGELCSLAITTADEDDGQTVTLSMKDAPEGATLTDNVFKWTAPDVASVTHEVTFIATDNGTPPLSNKSVVSITVETGASVVNTAPKWEVENIERAMSDTGKLTLSLSDLCKDPEEDLIAYALLDGAPEGDAVAGGEYRFTATPAAIGTHYAKITATDSEGLSDTLVIKITVENIDNDATPPVLTLITPSETSATSGSASFTIDALCSDPSGVFSAVALFEGKEFIAVVADNHYKMTVTGLKPGVANVITVSVKDASPAKNEATKVITVTLIKTGTVTFMKNDEAATGTMETQTIKSNESAALLPNAFSNAGYRFAGWATSPTGTVTYADEAELTMGTADVNLYAIWVSVQTYVVVYNGNGNTGGNIPVDTRKYETGTKVTVAANSGALVRDGYSFAGWNTKVNGSGTSYAPSDTFAMGTANDTLFAKWSTDAFTITYNLDGGTNNANNPLTYSTTTPTITLADPTKAGYTFGGWFENSALTGTAVTSIPAASTGDKAFWAKWSMDAYTITYNLDGGINNANNPLTYSTTTPAITLADPAKAGYTFGGWYDNSGLTGTAVTSIPAASTGDKAFWAKWTIKTYTITYHLDGGTNSASNPVSYTVATTAIALANATKSGYIFGGWFENSALTGTAVTSIPAASTGDKAFWAKWSTDAYTITYNLDGGTNNANNPLTYSTTTPAITLADPAKAGYTFGGWYDNSGLTGTAVTSIPAASTGDKAFWAKWTIKTYTITYNLDGGTNSASNPVSYTVATTAIALANATKTGYTFSGWYDNSGLAGTAVTSIPAASTGDKAFWAKWSTDAYTITYNLDGGTNNANNPLTYNTTTPAITLADPAKAGYTFGGWFDNSGLTGTAVTSIPAASTGDKAFWAKWTIKTYTITYNLDGGTNSASNPVSYTVATTAIALANATKSGYTFGGWFENSALTGTAVTSIPAASTGDKAFWAKWTTVSYTITYNLNGGTNSPNNPATYVISGSAIALSNPSRADYTFDGWYDNAGLTGTAVTGIPASSTGNKTFWAKWTAVSYTITYNLNGGTNNANNPTTYNVASTTITLATPTQTSYTFGGWYDNSGLTGTPVTSIPAGSTGNKTFWAKWTEISYSITYNLNGGTNSPNNPASYSASYGTFPLYNASRTDYTFDGWYDNAGFTGTAVTAITSGTTGNKTFWAKWTGVSYAITYNLNYGTNSSNNPATYVVGTAVTLYSPSRTGYTFNGWYSDAAFTTRVTTIPAGSTGDKSLWAKWTAISYTITYNLDGGTNSSSNPATYTYSGSTIPLYNPSKTCFEFDGWYSDANFTTRVYSIPAQSAENKSFWVKWIPDGPVITTQPESVPGRAGDERTFECVGPAGSSYQWYLASTGAAISGATSSTYTTVVEFTTTYYCIVRNSAGCTTQSNTVAFIVF